MKKLADQASPVAIARAAKRLGCRSVAYTYNAPVIFHEYAIDVAQECRQLGIKSVAVTAGFVCEKPRAESYRFMDAANVGLKAFSERFYWKITGGHLEKVLDTLRYLKHETDVWFEITNLLIPDENDSNAEIDAMTQWVVEELGPDVPMHFTALGSPLNRSSSTAGSPGGPHWSETTQETHPRTEDSEGRPEGDPPPQFTPVKWRPRRAFMLPIPILAYEKGRETVAELGEVIDDLVAEVQEELHEARDREAVLMESDETLDEKVAESGENR